ncbi:NodT family efflux transporter outer membrane factor (OMF) lipoprotein [Sphingomonas naasensis]|uniref:Efflux transporter outer membrane subunit n=1 Tax=Sphingomonas naasensis TaxID=1344951 RepID=A0A4S1WD56_9SPHN|nr:efflux transporter outer membrane subunit [Sphingomonas naasensis]NIJ19902.1 NodT family efflux transporter outer membrane factor (OMF) lipoprotein [Sphingomonas naasensis]TGX39975.1 efflux transporter outer membrane subunit [Sphingomonas naasensis]
MARRPLVLTLAVALPLAACAAGPDYRPRTAPELGVPDGYSVPVDQRAREDLTRWWEKFDDPQLASLVQRAQAANLDIAQAVTRLRQARESLVQQRASLLPSVSASAGASRSESLRGGTTTTTLPDGSVTSFSTGGRNSFSLGADANYQVDLFGGVRRGVESARADYQAAGFDYATVLISIEAETARNYVLARSAQAQLANAREALALQDDDLQIAQWRVQAGLVSSLDQEQARAQRAQTAAGIPSLEASYNGFVSRLGVLTGQAPGALKGELEAVRPIPRGPGQVAAGIPAEALRQRPDIRAAERNLASATARIGVAEAQLYPSLAIGGSIDAGSSALSSIFDVITGRLFANIAQTIFDAGRTRSQVRSAQAAADGAFLAYKQTVLTSLEDIENAVVALDSARRREAEFRIALEAANNQAILARMQYRSGLTDYTTLNQAQNALLSARNGVVNAQSDQSTALIQLYLSLGGGWDSNVTPEAPARTSSTTGGTADGN